MIQPLATLSRHGRRVVLFESAGAVRPSGTRNTSRSEADEPAPGTRIEFREHHDAIRYLRYWANDGSAMVILRHALHGSRWRPWSPPSDDAVIDSLAAHLASGRLMAMVETPRPRARGTVAMKSSEQTAAPASPTAPPRPAPIPLLPKLEQVQIEGAKVLPEILQALEQIDLTMGEIEIANVSLEPTPSGVESIDAELRESSGSVAATLGAL